MSQQLLSKSSTSLLHRLSSTTHQTLTNLSSQTTRNLTRFKGTTAPPTTLSNPVIPIKLYHPIHTHASSYLSHSKIYSTQAQTKRFTNNISKLYARRMLLLAALSASAMVQKSRMEQAIETIEKPVEWSTIDLVKQRREFAENFSSLGSTQLSRVWAAGSRILNLTLLATPLTILIPVSYLTGPQSSSTNFAWNYALWSIEKAGPTFIKLFQWATTRHDLFSTEFITRLSALQDNTSGHTWKETEKLLLEALGPNYAELVDFDHGIAPTSTSSTLIKTTSLPNSILFKRADKYKPIGSGCVAQVYKAKLKQDVNLLPAGTEVAIKVTHPNILHKVCVDFYILKNITSLFEMIPDMNYLSIKDSVQQFRDIMLPQLDLRVEANNLKRFRKNFENDPHVAFPMPVDDLTSEKVLVESFVHGETISKFCEEGRRTMKEREELARLGLETVMKMVFLYDFVHGDLHPGNIIVNRNTAVRGHPWRLNLIDCGLVVEMGEQDHVNLVKVLGAFIKRDGDLAANLMIDTAKKCHANELDVELFIKGIENITEMDDEENFLESVGDYISDICYLACKHKVKLEASFINAALACEIMEGIASKLYPALKTQSIALPLVFKAESMHRLNETFSFLK